MGNRAVLTIDDQVGIYIHWNGGVESVTAFLDACKERGYRDPAGDPTYALAKLTGLLCEFFGPRSDSSVGVGLVKNLGVDWCDNGLYRIGADWKIVEWTGGDLTAPWNEQQSYKHEKIVRRLVDEAEDVT